MRRQPFVMRSDARVERVEASAHTIPTSSPEADGTLEWRSTTIVVVEVSAAGVTGLGYTYSDASAAALVESKLSPSIRETSAMDVPLAWNRMLRQVRNVGRPGIAAAAISAVDAALWDLKARLLELPLALLLGRAREKVPVYFSGGFTSYAIDELQRQFAFWRERGVRRFKMKVGSEPAQDPDRVAAARAAIGPDCELMVDANGAYSAKLAMLQAARFAEQGVTWFEEPVSSDDLAGLRQVREHAPHGMHIAAGEYGYDEYYFRRMLAAEAVDVLQADATRCCGLTGFMRADALCSAFDVPLSAHTAPALHLHAGCAAEKLVHLEYFHDHVRIEQMLFDGVCEQVDGELGPDLTRPGSGLEFRRAEAARFAA